MYLHHKIYMHSTFISKYFINNCTFKIFIFFGRENKRYTYIFKIVFNLLIFLFSNLNFNSEREESEKGYRLDIDASKISTESHETTAIAGNSRNEGGYVG